MAGRVKEGFARLGDVSLVAIAAGCGYVGYNWNALEASAAKKKSIRGKPSHAELRHIEKSFFQLAKQYDLNVNQLTEKRDQVYKIGEEIRTLSAKVVQLNKEAILEVQRLEKLLKLKEELQHTAYSLRQQKRSLDAEAQELSKLVKTKEDLQARSMYICSASRMSQVPNPSSMQERNRVLEAEIEELMRLVKVKEELQAKSEAFDEPGITPTGNSSLKKDDPT